VSTYLIRRLLSSVLTVFAMVTLVFFLVRAGGDPTALYVSEEASLEQIEAVRQQMGFDRPVFVQYTDFMKNLLLQGDLGDSFRMGSPALSIVLSHLPATARLAAVAFLISIAIAIPAGIISAVKRNSLVDALARVLALLGICVPSFWLGIILILLFAVKFPVLPSSGSGQLKYLILPGITLGVHSMAVIMRMLRSNMIDVLGNDYIRTARAKGLESQYVILRHALKNASIPIVTVIAMRIGSLFSGAILVETVFAYPGMGQIAIQSIYQRDFAVVQAFVVVVGSIMILCNFIADILYGYLDPRIKLT
jgi:peptide/nickel transport system permease protein